MPIKPKIGALISGNRGTYEIISQITEGNMAWSLEARERDTHERIFLKYYKSPTPKVRWFGDYVDYVFSLNQRLEESYANQYCVLCKDLFTANPNPAINPCDYLFQAYEYIESGQNLRDLLNEDVLSWERRKGIAKIFLVSMRRIHEARVVHCDLKPENIQILPDAHAKLGLIPRMIDMDRSIMEDRAAPWTTGDDREGYVGTPGYFSPEHLRGETPTTASDVFTVAIILCELLCGSHPFAAFLENADDYKAAVLAGSQYAPVGLIGDLGDAPGNARKFEELLIRALSPNPAERPSCKELHQALLSLDRKASVSLPPGETSSDTGGEISGIVSVTPKPSGDTVMAEAVAKPSPSLPAVPPKLEPEVPSVLVLQLTGDMGVFTARISMDVGRGALGSVSSESRFCSRYQFRVVRNGRNWSIEPCSGEVPSAMTMVNQTELTSPLPLREGDEICLQGRASGKQAMRLRVSFG